MSFLSIVRGLALVTVCIYASARAADADTLVESRAALLARHLCERCHGPGGRSRMPAYPALAGQQAAYLVAQFEAFRTSREEPEAQEHMLGFSAAFDDDLIAALARYYSGQSPLRGRRGNATRIKTGRELYLGGDPALGIPPCAGCHGEHAEGKDAVPRLAGQHAVYLTRQMRVIQSSDRDSALMHEAVGELTPEQVRGLALYLQSR